MGQPVFTSVSKLIEEIDYLESELDRVKAIVDEESDNENMDVEIARADFRIMEQELDRLGQIVELSLQMAQNPCLKLLHENDLVPGWVITGEKMIEWLEKVLTICEHIL